LALLDHRQRLLHRLRGVLDHATRQLAPARACRRRSSRVGEDLSGDAHARPFCYFMVFAIR